MTLYCVRIPPTCKDKDLADEIVGIFNAKSIWNLIALIDECCEPDGLEYAVMPEGGMYWSGRGPKIRDLYEYNEEGTKGPFATFSTGDGFSFAGMWDFQELKFKPLDYPDE